MPLGHVKQVASEVARVVSEYLPEPQEMQVVLWSSANFPLGHASQEEAPYWLIFPEEHGEHRFDSLEGCNTSHPAGHAVQTVDPGLAADVVGQASQDVVLPC